MQPVEQTKDRWGKRNTAGVSIASSLSFEAVSHAFGDTCVLENVSINTEPGEVLCLLGPSGSGKTTLLRIAAGIERQTSGSVRIDGRLISGGNTHVTPENRGIGLVFQDFALFPHMTLLENVRFGLRGVARKAADDEAMRMLARVGMDGSAMLYPHSLSGGEQQRVALARALAPRPGILLMDEPFSGLDARLRDSVRDETLSLLRDMRATTVIVTHDPEEALRVADHIALLRAGELVQHGTGQDIYYRPASLFAARFFSELNAFSVDVRDGSAQTPLGRQQAGNNVEQGRATACVRLADVIVEVPGDARGATLSSVAGRVTERRFVGIAEILEMYVEGFDEPVRARVRAGELPTDIRDVRVRVRDGAMMYFAAE